MTETEKRFEDLVKRAENKHRCTYTDFLGIAQISELKGMKLKTAYCLWGGYENAERVVCCFGDRKRLKDLSDFPISCVLIEPLNQKFADELTHRDFLGAVIGLGLRREVIGDIIIKDNCGYVFCLEKISGFIVKNLERVRRTSVKCSVTDNVPTALVVPEVKEIIVSSERVDAVIAGVVNVSRNDTRSFFVRDRVFVNGEKKKFASQRLKAGDIITIRGYGRFTYDGVLRTTKKDRLVAQISVLR